MNRADALKMGKISGLEMLNCGLTDDELRKLGWRPGPPNEDAWYAPSNEFAPSPWLHEAVAPKAEKSLYEECLAVQDFPMSATADQPSEVEVTDEMVAAGDYAASFLSLGHPAPGVLAKIYRAMAAVAPVAPTWDEIGSLEAKNQEWYDIWSVAAMQRQQAVARVAELEAEIAALKQAHTAFINPTPADLPPPARRPDGTLAPEPKPFPALKQAVTARRVGG